MDILLMCLAVFVVEAFSGALMSQEERSAGAHFDGLCITILTMGTVVTIAVFQTPSVWWTFVPAVLGWIAGFGVTTKIGERL